MDFEFSPKVQDLRKRLLAFMDDHIYPNEALFEEQVAEGGMRFHGSGNVTYIGCQDPTALVSLSIGTKTRELNGVKFNTDVNSANLSVLTDGSMIKGINGCVFFPATPSASPLTA